MKDLKQKDTNFHITNIQNEPLLLDYQTIIETLESLCSFYKIDVARKRKEYLNEQGYVILYMSNNFHIFIKTFPDKKNADLSIYTYDDFLNYETCIGIYDGLCNVLQPTDRIDPTIDYRDE
jgi:S-adenosylmethionine/arginine decarboxylase-like enzyme